MRRRCCCCHYRRPDAAGTADALVHGRQGSVAVAGAAVRWLRDNLGILSTASEIEGLAAAVPSTAGVYFVPAFSGLYAPYWRTDARGSVRRNADAHRPARLTVRRRCIVGLNQYSDQRHLARATLEAVCFQTVEVRPLCDTQSAPLGGH